MGAAWIHLKKTSGDRLSGGFETKVIKDSAGTDYQQ